MPNISEKYNFFIFIFYFSDLSELSKIESHFQILKKIESESEYNMNFQKKSEKSE